MKNANKNIKLYQWIPIEPNEIIFSSVEFKIRTVKITEEIMKKNRLVVEVNERVNFLDEIVISPENTEKFLDLKEEEFKKVDYIDDKSTAVENEIIRQNQLYRGINIVNVAKLLAKVLRESKIEEEIKLTPSKALPLVFDKNFFIRDLGLKNFDIDEKNKSFWFINGERRISWSENPPFNNPVIKGKWWNKDEKNRLQISLDYKVADDLKLKIGDSMTFNIFGNSVTGIITNFRKVDYRDLNINFAILFNPKYASQIPHEFMSTIKFENEELVNLSNILRKLPTITYIKLSEYINKTKKFLNGIFIVSILLFYFVKS